MSKGEEYKKELVKWAKRRKKIKAMREKGVSMAMIGARFGGISRERVRQILNMED